MVTSARLKELWKDPEYRARQIAKRNERYAEGTEARAELLHRLEALRDDHFRRIRQAAANRERGAQVRGGRVPLPYKELYDLIRKAFSARKAYKIIKVIRQIVDSENRDTRQRDADLRRAA